MRLSEWWGVRPFFDATFYLAKYPDVRQAGIDPLRHYLRHGAAEGRKPHPLFEPEYYLSCCPVARQSEMPLLHFIATGGLLGNPHPLFDCKAYLAAHPQAARINPLLHYLRKSSGRESRASHGRPTHTLEILDVRVELAFWESQDGRLEFIAEPQQQPFFRSLRFDQLVAQIKP